MSYNIAYIRYYIMTLRLPCAAIISLCWGEGRGGDDAGEGDGGGGGGIVEAERRMEASGCGRRSAVSEHEDKRTAEETDRGDRKKLEGRRRRKGEVGSSERQE